MTTLRLLTSPALLTALASGHCRTVYYRPTRRIRSQLFDPEGTPRHYDTVTFVTRIETDPPTVVCRFIGASVVGRHGGWFYGVQVGAVVEVRNVELEEIER